MTVKVIIRIVATILVSSSCFAQYSTPADHVVSQDRVTSRQIDSLVEQCMRAFKVPGMAVSVVKDGKITHMNGYGVQSIKNQLKVNEHTLFGIASNTKAFTAAAMAILVDEAKLNWDDKVIHWIPEFRMYDPYVTEELTIRDLLTHRSGMATGAGDLMHDPDSSNFTISEIINNLRYIKPVYSFRSRFAYDNNMFIVAGEVISRASGMKWEDFVEQRILIPLGMDQSSASWNGCKSRSNIIDAHKIIGGTIHVIARYSSPVCDAAGGIYSSVADMSKWVLMLLNNGKYGDGFSKQMFSEVALREMWAPQTILRVGKPGIYNTHFGAYGIGWYTVEAKGYKEILHTGQDNGMVSEVAMIPELNLGIIVLTNQEGSSMSAITDQIVDGYLGIKGTDRIQETLKRSQTNEETVRKTVDKVWKELADRPNTNAPPDLNIYSGAYRDVWFGDLIITAQQNQLLFSSKRSPQLTGKLFPYRGNTFVIKWNSPEIDADAFVMFNLDENGKASGITLKSISAGYGFNYTDLNFHRLK